MSKQFLHDGDWMVSGKCPTCHVSHAFPLHIYEAAKQRAGEMGVFCPNGHSWVYKTQKQISEDEQTRLERDRLRQQLAQKDDEIKRQRDRKEEEQRRVVALRGVITKTKKRIAGGVCPCCNRTFQNLAEHMAAQHKGYDTSDPEAAEDKPASSCSAEGCTDAVKTMGMCMKHYQLDYRQRKLRRISA